MNDRQLYRSLRRIASRNPETRPHLMPILRKYADCGDDMMAGRDWGTGRGKVDDSIPYRSWPDSPPAGKNNSPQRETYNEWYRKNVCPDKHKTTCGDPSLKKALLKRIARKKAELALLKEQYRQA